MIGNGHVFDTFKFNANEHEHPIKSLIIYQKLLSDITLHILYEAKSSIAEEREVLRIHHGIFRRTYLLIIVARAFEPTFNVFQKRLSTQATIPLSSVRHG